MDPKPRKRKLREQEDPSSRLNRNFNLRITKMLVEAMGGKMWIEGEGQGKPCTVWFRLPRKQPIKQD